MDILVQGLGKKFQKHWVFRDFNYHFKNNHTYAITGPNGSGKSTLLQIISGFAPASSGLVQYKNPDGGMVPESVFYQYHTFAAPYLELIEEFTLFEILQFHFSFKKPVDGLNLKSMATRMYLSSSLNKQIKYFSSGMKQRLKLGLAFYAESPILLLDEPTTNLDEKGVEWYHQEVTKARENRLILVSSNIKNEYKYCRKVIDLLDFKNF